MTDEASTRAYLNLTPDQIITTLESLGFHCDGRLLTLNSYENRVYQVGIEESTPVVAKFYRPARWSDEAILEEHAFSQELADLDIPVVAPLALDGQTLHRCGHFRVAVAPCRGGRSPELDDSDSMRQLGRLVARMCADRESEDGAADQKCGSDVHRWLLGFHPPMTESPGRTIPGR